MPGPVLDVTVPVTLRREDGNYSLIFKDDQGREAMCALESCVESGGHGVVLRAWADHEFLRGAYARRRKTGAFDKNGTTVFEGDVVIARYNEHYPEAPACVHWSQDKAAFVLKGSFEGGGGWESLNLAEVKKYEIVGNVFENQLLMTPAKQVEAAGIFPRMRNSIG